MSAAGDTDLGCLTGPEVSGEPRGSHHGELPPLALRGITRSRDHCPVLGAGKSQRIPIFTG